jgi:DNA mismatch repair protein MutL
MVSNRIAAGEVVERPASVVKELVENALDAESSRIVIGVEKGGRSLIEISDNGTGMRPDDALLCIERYATSKLQTEADLFSIKTLGFRGEALPSIAAVSKFTLTTRHKSRETGTRIEIQGGRIQSVTEVGAAPGTLIAVRNLFYNVPARRKFLKTTATEMAHIADTVAGISLASPGVHFQLYHDGKLIKNWVSASAQDRIADVLGNALGDGLIPVQLEDERLRFSGWISSPGLVRSTPDAIFIYVNGRRVHDRMVRHALLEGFRGRLLKGRYPAAVLFVRVPSDQVDVNVHPTKHEVRFAAQEMVHQSVSQAIADVLKARDRVGWKSPAVFTRPGPSVMETAPACQPAQSAPKLFEVDSPAAFVSDGPSSALWPKKRFEDLRIIGQLHDAYILCEAGRELILIDQHAAHERILFEKLQARDIGPSQKLLIPEAVDLSYRQAASIEKLIPELRLRGIEIEAFGGTTFVVSAVPQFLGLEEIQPLIVELAETISALGVSADLDALQDRFLASMACHGAIRSGQRLNDEEARMLLRQLDGCRIPAHCPHGRPTWISWDLKSIERSFKRIV